MLTTSKTSSKKIPKKKRIGLFIFSVLILIITIFLSHLFISILILRTQIDITKSTIQSNEELGINFRGVSVDVYLYNPGGTRMITVWVEITHQATNVSFSKTELVQLEYKQQKKVTIDFILDKLAYPGEFIHRVWLTYPNSND
jgi:hypothetical protein